MSKQLEIIKEKRKLALLRTIFESILLESDPTKQGGDLKQSNNKETVNKANAK